jgi:hypothetical protein
LRRPGAACVELPDRRRGRPGASAEARFAGMMTVETAIDRLVTGDLLVHTWYLARSTGQSVRLDPNMSLEVVT